MRKLFILLVSLIGLQVSSESLIFDMIQSCQTLWPNSILFDIKWLTVDSIMKPVPLQNFKLDNNSDTVYFRFRHNAGDGGTSVTIWNNSDSMTIYSPDCFFGTYSYSTHTKNSSMFEYWEEELIEDWNIDSIKVLTLLPAEIASPPYIYLVRFIVSNKNLKIDATSYKLPSIPNELADSATLRYRQKRAERLGRYTR